MSAHAGMVADSANFDLAYARMLDWQAAELRRMRWWMLPWQRQKRRQAADADEQLARALREIVAEREAAR